jgi:Tol biopolymer transport system component
MTPSRGLSPLDQTVALTALIIIVLTGLVLWRGDQVGLAVTAFTPAAGSTATSIRSPITLQFDDTLATVDGVRVVAVPPLSGTVSSRGNTLVFTPAAPLSPATTYTLTLEGTLQGRQGHALRSPPAWSFTTAAMQLLFTDVERNPATQTATNQLFAVPAVFAPQPPGGLPARSRLTDTPYGVWDSALSPDGSTIIFSSLSDGGNSDLWITTPGSARSTLLLACPEAFCSTVSFAPDGTLIAFSQRNASQFGASSVSPPRLYLLELATGASYPVFSDSQKLGFDARWSRDGQWLAYLSSDRGGLGVYNLLNGEERFYSTPTGESGVWSPVENRLLFTELRQLTGTVSSTEGSTVSNTVSNTVDAATPLYVVHINSVNPVTGEQINLSGEQAPVEDSSPAFSPDGAWIAFRRMVQNEEGGGRSKQLWLMPSDGGDARPLTNDPTIDFGPPAWSPDGRYLLFHRFPLRGPEIVISVWMMDVATGEMWQVATPGQRPQWLP